MDNVITTFRRPKELSGTTIGPRALQTTRRVCVLLLPGSGREKIRRPSRIKYSSGEECAATIRLSNAEINPLTALALDLQSSESPSLFPPLLYVYPFDRDKFDFACPPSLSLSLSRSTTISSWTRAEEICVNYEIAFAGSPSL